LPNVDSKLVGNERKLIGESDVDVAERVLCKFCHLSSYIIGWEQLSIAECRVNSSCTLSSLFRLPTDDAVIGAKFLHRLAWEDSFWAVSKVNNRLVIWILGTVSNKVGAKLQNLIRHLLGGKRWGSRFKND